MTDIQKKTVAKVVAIGTPVALAALPLVSKSNLVTKIGSSVVLGLFGVWVGMSLAGSIYEFE